MTTRSDMTAAGMRLLDLLTVSEAVMRLDLLQECRMIRKQACPVDGDRVSRLQLEKLGLDDRSPRDVAILCIGRKQLQLVLP